MTAPHPSYTAMEAAWDPERREQARTDKLARDIDQHRLKAATYPTRPAWAGDLSKQRRQRKP